MSPRTYYPFELDNHLASDTYLCWYYAGTFVDGGGNRIILLTRESDALHEDFMSRTVHFRLSDNLPNELTLAGRRFRILGIESVDNDAMRRDGLVVEEVDDGR